MSAAGERLTVLIQFTVTISVIYNYTELVS